MCKLSVFFFSGYKPTGDRRDAVPLGVVLSFAGSLGSDPTSLQGREGGGTGYTAVTQEHT